ncbi:hypothetical protein QBC38DRAFT_547938 [Podospora fimiseda]|uniref:Uncharacterized protein n=1 Tax=Podospora fimiseda TaxID=252190 RepID=A0AAN7BIV4_9PEZI|nr:hypothetical protein QBC38DRAFT_547938 [Podospora fimiseda]
MQLSTLTIQTIAFLAATSQAWMLTAYDKSGNCNTNSAPAPRTRVLTGAPNLTRCFTFDQSMPGTGCTEYFPGGQRACGPSGSLLPMSVRTHSGGCKVYREVNCQGYATEYPAGNWCVAGWGAAIRSFSCSG